MRRLIKSFTFALSLLFLVLNVSGKSCLWKVTSETGILYVQGSIHVLKTDSYPLAPAIEKAYAASQKLILEVDMAEMTSLGTQAKIMAMAALPEGKTLKTELDTATYQALKKACEKVGLPVNLLEKLKPWFVSTTLTLLKMQKMGFDAKDGLDKHFYDKAMADKKTVMGLESIDFQLNLFDSLSKENPSAFVKKALADLDDAESDVEKLHQAWVDGDLDAMGALMKKSFDTYPEFYQTFVLDRNVRWMKKLNKLLKKSETCMVVVGAGHLPGKDGLLDLLRKKGYTVEQL
jgi:uncharacterized protein YbaP (TraB family)